MKTGLILIDIQNDYFPGGKMELVGMEKAADQARSLLAAFRDGGLPTFHIQHVFQSQEAPFFVPATPGVEIHENIRPLPGECIVTKHHPNSFLGSVLLERIRQAEVENLVLCGAMSHMCVDATTRAAADFGFVCTVVHDACATTHLEFEGRRIDAAEVHGAYMAALAWGYARMKTAGEAIRDLKEAGLAAPEQD